MFCPKCKYEYVDGINICGDCGTELVEELPIEKFEYVELTTIAETNDLGLIAIAKSILDSEGIKYYINDMQGFIPGCNLFIQIKVPISEAINAKELLKDIEL